MQAGKGGRSGTSELTRGEEEVLHLEIKRLEDIKDGINSKVKTGGLQQSEIMTLNSDIDCQIEIESTRMIEYKRQIEKLKEEIRELEGKKEETHRT